jgi:shikimate dehydrogenase
MVYGASITSFNAWCRDTAGCETADGIGMLVEQAALSFRIWFSAITNTDSLDTAAVISDLRKNL